MSLIREHIERFSPNVICFTAVASQFQFVSKVAYFIKDQWTDIFLVIGGVHVTLKPDEVITGSFDALCISEGEYPVLELCNQLVTGDQPHGIRNLWFKSPTGMVEKNVARPFMDDIDHLPFPDRDMWRPWVKEQMGADLSILLGRGCPNDCTYCCHHAIKTAAPGSYVRLRSPENIVQEVALVHKQYPSQHRIFMEVESIVLDKAWTIELCRQLEAFNHSIDNSLFYACNFRISRQSTYDGTRPRSRPGRGWRGCPSIGIMC